MWFHHEITRHESLHKVQQLFLGCWCYWGFISCECHHFKHTFQKYYYTRKVIKCTFKGSLTGTCVRVGFIGVVTHWSRRLVNNNVCQQLRLGSSCHQICSVLLPNLNQHKQSSALVYRTQSVDTVCSVCIFFLSVKIPYFFFPVLHLG